jgi:hypothetical protein
MIFGVSDRVSGRTSYRVVEDRANGLVVTDERFAKGADCSVSDSPLLNRGADGLRILWVLGVPSSSGGPCPPGWPRGWHHLLDRTRRQRSRCRGSAEDPGNGGDRPILWSTQRLSSPWVSSYRAWHHDRAGGGDE